MAIFVGSTTLLRLWPKFSVTGTIYIQDFLYGNLAYDQIRLAFCIQGAGTESTEATPSCVLTFGIPPRGHFWFLIALIDHQGKATTKRIVYYLRRLKSERPPLSRSRKLRSCGASCCCKDRCSDLHTQAQCHPAALRLRSGHSTYHRYHLTMNERPFLIVTKITILRAK